MQIEHYLTFEKEQLVSCQLTACRTFKLNSVRIQVKSPLSPAAEKTYYHSHRSKGASPWPDSLVHHGSSPCCLLFFPIPSDPYLPLTPPFSSSSHFHGWYCFYIQSAAHSIPVSFTLEQRWAEQMCQLLFKGVVLEVKGSVSVCLFSVEKQHFGNETLISVLFRTKRSIVHDCGHKNHFLSLSFLNPVLKYSSHESIFILKTLLIWWIYLNSSKAWKLKCKKNLRI